MSSQEREQYFELNEPDFQKIINILEAKGQNQDNKPILKLNFMIRLRKKAGTRYSSNLDMWPLENGQVYDSSHIVGIQVISDQVRRRKKNKLKALGLHESKKSLKGSPSPKLMKSKTMVNKKLDR